MSRRPRVLVVNCYSDSHRGARGSALFVPQSMAASVLAGQLHRDKVDVRAHCEFAQGPLESLETLRWPDLLVLTGLNPAFDRMKQITAYARTLNPGVAVALGGPVARALPRLCRRYFDYVCTGDVEQIVEVAEATFGPGLGSEMPLPRYDLAPRHPLIGFAESTRNCNFRCHFCSMTAEDRPFHGYEDTYLRHQVEAIGRRACVMFLDQNFYGGGRRHFRQRIELLRELRGEGLLRGWAALVTADFFNDAGNLELARETGCIGVFSGVESFNDTQIAAYRKKQNLILPQEEVIARCLENGLTFHYGMMFDPSERHVAGMREEIAFIVDNPRLALPSFLSFAIPILGTPLFRQRLAEGSLLPNLKLRDMDGRSVVCHTLDDLDRVVAFAHELDRGVVGRARLLRHAGRFSAHYRGKLKGWSLASALSSHWAMAFPRLGSNGRERKVETAATRRNFLTSTEPQGTLYEPAIRIDARYQNHFEPLHITDSLGELHPSVEADLNAGTMAKIDVMPTLPDPLRP